MRFSTILAAALVPAASVYAVDHFVTVGDGGLAYNPANITAAQGDTVTFEFRAKNHTVTQSTFAAPCSLMTTPQQGIDSGFVPVADGSTTFSQWSITIDNASAPLWFYCAQKTPANHCQAGMVFSVNANPDSDRSHAAFVAAAMATNGSAGAGGAGATGSGATVSATGGASASASADGGAATDAPGNGVLPRSAQGGLGLALAGMLAGLLL